MKSHKRRTARGPDAGQQSLFDPRTRLLEDLDEKARKELRSLMAELLLEAASRETREEDGDE
jgi:hypothetical protein